MIRFIKKYYKILNTIVLCFCIYIFCFPLISNLMEKVFPGITYCPFLAMTGKPCPFCGGTRYIKGLPNNLSNISYFLNFFGIFMITVLIEFIYRIINLFKRKYSEKQIKIDIIVHIVLLFMLILYELIYIIILFK